MSDGRLPKQLLYGVLSQGKCEVGGGGGQMKRFKDYLKGLDINLNTGESIAMDHPACHSSLTKGSFAPEKRRTAEAERKRAASKARATFTCTHPYVFHLWACLSGPDRPRQPPPDQHSQIFHLTLTSRSSSNQKDEH